MCGICGFYETSGERLSREQLCRMTDTLAYRGPDASGTVLAEHGNGVSFTAENGNLGLGHRRLSILDLSEAANQPMLFQGGRLAVIHNGEIFNYREIIAEHFPDRVPKTDSDTEVIGWAYEKWGLDCFKYFNGFFAMAIYDADKDRLVLARDRMGKKPLFYYSKGGHFAFGSELKALMAYPPFSKSLDKKAFLDYLAFLYVPGEGCILKNCRKLPAGGWLTISGNGEIQKGRYYDLVEEQIQNKNRVVKSQKEYLETLDRLLTDATRIRLRSDVPLGAFLSGGIDSSIIAAYMTKVSSQTPKTFTIGYEDPKFNEGAFATAVAGHLATDHTELIVQPNDALTVIERMPEIYDEPFADPSALPTTLLSQLTRKHVTVALTGDGGDELFFGYDRDKRVLSFPLWGWIPHVLRQPVIKMLCLFGGRGVKNGRRLDQKDIYSFFLHRSTIFNHYSFPDLTGEPFPENNPYATVFRDRLADVPLHRRLRAMETSIYLCDDILQKVDRASMSVALECRAPLLDYRIVNFALSLPQSMVLQGRKRKVLLKKLLFQHLPPHLFDHPKMGFRIPLETWFRGKLRPMLDHYLEPTRLEKQGLINPNFVTKTIEDHMSGKSNSAHGLFALLVFQMWMETYLE